MRLSAVKRVKGSLRVPSDKSITHRAIIFGSMADGSSSIKKWLRSQDTEATLNIVRLLGTEVDVSREELFIKGRNFTFEEPKDILDAKNSGTTARLIMGLLATQSFFSVMTGDSSLRNRPMLRVVKPLRDMGALIDGRENGNKLPVSVRGGSLKAISFFNKKASAQVKSSLIIAGLRAEGITEIVEPILSRDHTERMLKFMGANIEVMELENGHLVKVKGFQKIHGTEIICPADPSSAAFFAALATLVESAELILEDVLINPTRDGFFRKLKECAGNVEYMNVREVGGEQIADIYIKNAQSIKPINIKPEEVPSLIDEIPILSIIMAFADGISCVRGASELRVKESDRIRAVVENLRNMGISVEEFDDGFCVEGGKRLRGTLIKSYGDHRIAMAFSVAGLVAEGETVIDDPECVKISYPDFFKDLHIIVRNGNI